MGLRSILPNYLLKTARGLGRSLGCELVVETSSHSIDVRMEVPGTKHPAWDPDMFKSGQLFHKEYANPYKPIVEADYRPGQPDRMSAAVADGGDEIDTQHEGFELVTSGRYREYADQALISELVRPAEMWSKILYALIGIGALVLIVLVLQFVGVAGIA